MTPPAKAACLLSLAGEAYDAAALRQLADWQARRLCEITFVALDDLEKINDETLGLPSRTVDEFRGLIEDVQWPGPVRLVSFSRLAECRSYVESYQRVAGLLEHNAGLRGLLHAQTYRNLQPVLRGYDIRNQRHPAVQILSEYLVQEISLLSALAVLGYEAEIGFHRRGQIHKELCRLGLVLPPAELVTKAAPAAAVELSSLSMRVGGSGRTVGPFSSTLEYGEVLGVIGPNGSGKTTLLRAMAGHIPACAGTLSVQGRCVDRLSPGERGVATLFQDGGLLQAISARANLEIAVNAARRRGHDTSNAAPLLEALDLDGEMETQASSLSGGQQQLVGFARALSAAPQVLLLDEPTASLDTSRKNALASVLKARMARKDSVAVVVSHDIAFLFSVADRILVLDAAGQEHAIGAASDFYNGGLSFLAASLVGAQNVFRITGRTPSELVLDNWLKLAVGRHPPDAAIAGVRIPFAALEVRKTRALARVQESQVIQVVPGVIRSRRLTPEADFILFEPDADRRASGKFAAARGLYLARGSTANLNSMRVDLVINGRDLVWLN